MTNGVGAVVENAPGTCFEGVAATEVGIAQAVAVEQDLHVLLSSGQGPPASLLSDPAGLLRGSFRHGTEVESFRGELSKGGTHGGGEAHPGRGSRSVREPLRRSCPSSGGRRVRRARAHAMVRAIRSAGGIGSSRSSSVRVPAVRTRGGIHVGPKRSARRSTRRRPAWEPGNASRRWPRSPSGWRSASQSSASANGVRSQPRKTRSIAMGSASLVSGWGDSERGEGVALGG